MQSKRAAVIAVGALMAGASLAACSSPSPSAASSTTKPKTTVTTTTAAPATSAPSTSAPSTTAAPGATTTSTTAPQMGQCPRVTLKVAEGQSQGAAGTVDIPFTISNSGPEPCILDGYPTVGLVGASGPVTPVVTHTGQAPAFRVAQTVVNLPPTRKASAGFVLEYSDVQIDGQQSCPSISTIKITLPGLGGTFQFARQFSPCGAPNISISAVVTAHQASLG